MAKIIRKSLWYIKFVKSLGTQNFCEQFELKSMFLINVTINITSILDKSQHLKPNEYNLHVILLFNNIKRLLKVTSE